MTTKKKPCAAQRAYEAYRAYWLAEMLNPWHSVTPWAKKGWRKVAYAVRKGSK